MPGAPAPEYIKARRTLLDAIGVLEAHLEGLVLVGAQAIYLHVGGADIAIPEYTTDADMAVAPEFIAKQPLIEDALADAGFRYSKEPGRWISSDGVYLDLLVPASLAGSGRRGADLGVHGRLAARRAHGLEGALIDRKRIKIPALDSDDPRIYEIWVAGPAALLVAKSIKIAERAGTRGREVDKDALDVSRLLRAVSIEDLLEGMNRLLSHGESAATTREAIGALRRLFGNTDAEGTLMAVRAATPLMDSNVLAGSVVALTRDLLSNLPESIEP